MAFLPRLRAPGGGAALRSQLAALGAGGALFALHLWSFFMAAHHTSVAHCVVLFASAPVMVSAMNWWLTGVALTPRWVLSYLLALVGLVVLTLQSWLGRAGESATLYGDAMAILAAVTFAGFALLAKKPRAALGNVPYTAATNVFAALTMALMGVGLDWWAPGVAEADGGWWLTPRAWQAVVAMALVPSLLGHATFMYCHRWIDINLLSCGKLLEPVMAVVLAQLFLGEPILPHVLIALGLVSAGVFNLFLPGLRFGRGH